MLEEVRTDRMSDFCAGSRGDYTINCPAAARDWGEERAGAVCHRKPAKANGAATSVVAAR
jgi:hypothetical protein